MAETFRINVEVDTSRVKPGVRKVKDELQSTTQVASRLGGVLRQALGALTAGVGLATAIRTLASFGQEMSTLQAITRATGAEFDALRTKAQELGATTRFSATEAAQGMTFLARAGFDANEVFGSIEGTLTLAQAGALGLGEAADIASNVLTGFRLEVSRTGEVVDTLALAANSSNTDVRQLGDAIKFVAPVAASVGVSLQEATAAIGALSDAGLQGSLAGTGLRRVISELESPTTKTTEILAKLGLTADDVRVSEVGLTTALSRLAGAGIEAGEALEVFGDRGGPAFLVLQDSIPRVQQFTEELGSAEGTAARIASTMDDNLNGAILATRSAFEGLILALGDSGATGAFRGFFDLLTSGLRLATANIDQFVAGLEGLAFVIGVNLSQQAIPAAISALNRLTVAALANPFTAVAAAITITIGAIIAFREQIAALEIGGTRLGDIVGAGFDAISERAVFAFEIIAEIGGRAWNSITESARAAFSNLGTILSVVLADIGLNFNDLLEPALSVFKKIFNGVVGYGKSIGDFWGEVFALIGRQLSALAEFDFSSPIESAKRLGDALTTNVGDSLDQILVDVRGNFSRDWAQEFTDLGANAAQFVFTGFRGLSGGAAAEAFFDIGGDISDRIAEREGARLYEKYEAGFVGAAELGGPPVIPPTALTGPAFGPQPLGPIPGLPVAPDIEVPDRPELVSQEELATFESLIGLLDQEAQLLGLSSSARQQAVAILQAEEQLKRSLTETERQQYAARFENVLALERQAELLDQIKGPQEELALTQQALNALFSEGKISVEEYGVAMQDLGLQAAQLDNSLTGGISLGLKQVGAQLEDISGMTSNLVVSAFSSAEDAILEFTRTGKLNFREFAVAILADIQRIILRLLLLKAIEALGGGATFGLSSAGADVAGARAEGGPVSGGKSYLVGEEGPELFTPRSAGNVIPAGQTAAMMNGGGQRETVVNVPPAQPVVNTYVVEDESKITQTMESPAGERAIINVIRKNPSLLARV
jgi:TP901 family phage tail tape measure protein